MGAHITSEISLPHRLWRLLPANARRAGALGVSNWLAPTPDRMPPATATGVTVAGEIGRASGLGEGARIMANAIRALGVPVGTRQAGLVLPGETNELGETPPGADDPGRILVLHVNPPVLPAACLRLGPAALRGRRVVGYWAWELPVVPRSWRSSARLVHEVWAPSQFTARALDTILPGRVRVVPHALAASPPCPSGLGREELGLPADAIVVLVSFSLASSVERKNPLGAIAAFRSAFGGRTDRRLVLKIGKPGHFPADMQRITDAVRGSSNITVETRTFSAADTHALTRAADIVLSLHRSEGFGLVPAEAMMLERPVIATDWSATGEFLDASCGVPIPARLITARDPRGVYGAPGAEWAEPDHDAAVEALRSLASDAGRRAALGRAAAARARAHFSVDPLQRALRAAGVASA